MLPSPHLDKNVISIFADFTLCIPGNFTKFLNTQSMDIKMIRLKFRPQPSGDNKICAVTCDFQQCGILTSVDSDEPLQPPFKLRNSK